MREDGYLDQTVCTNCDEPHPARTLIEADGAWLLCRQFGKVEVCQAHVRAYRYDHDEMVRQVAGALDCGRDRPRALIDGELWMVGRTSLSEKATLTTLYAPRLPDLGAHARIEGVISALPSSDCGLVIVGSAAELPPARRKWLYAPLHEVAHLVPARGLAIDRGRLSALFPEQSRRKPGRPTTYDLQKVDKARRRVEERTGRDAGPTETRKEFAKCFPNEDVPAHATVVRNLAKLRSS